MRPEPATINALTQEVAMSFDTNRASKMLRNCQSGFTLIEIMLVVVIIGLIVGVAIPNISKNRAKGFDTKAKSDIAATSV
jgi:general secretion pathway protein G